MADLLVRDVIEVLDAWYPRGHADTWDAVGTSVGDPAVPLQGILLAVDPVSAVVADTIDSGANLLVTHHPLLLRGVTEVATTTSKGRVVTDLVRHGITLHTCHTNADSPTLGVSESMALALGLEDLAPLEPSPDDATRGSGRIGTLPEATTLRDLASRVVAALPANHSAARIAGDPDALVRRVALCGGSGDFLLDHARAQRADVYVTSDLRHHPVSELREHADAPAVVDVPHWAAEWTWLPVLADRLRHWLSEQGSTVQVQVSTVVTDPWTSHLGWPE